MTRREMTEAESDAAKRLEAIWAARSETLQLSKEEAAAAMGITRQAVWQHISGKMPIGLEACIRWAEVLHCDPAEIRPDLADRFDAVVRLRAGASAGQPQAPNAALLRACLSAAFDEARKADRYPTNDLIASLTMSLYEAATLPRATDHAPRT